MLLPLARACPRLQHLTLHGRFGPSFLAQFGSNCPELTHLEAILTNLSPTTLQTLPTLLPQLTTLTAVPRPPLPMNQYSSEEGKPLEQARDGEAIRTALLACPGLISVDTGSCEITQAIWQALPSGLHSLGCSTQACMLGVGLVWELHSGLRSLTLAGSVNIYDHQESGRVSISALALLLAAAPNVTTCHMTGSLVVDATFSRVDALSVQVVDACIGAGLALSGVQRMWFKPQGRGRITLLFEAMSDRQRLVTDIASPSYQHHMSAFMANHMDKPLRNITDVEFHNEDGGREAPADLTHLPRVFPNVEALTVNNMYLSASDADALVACKSLRDVVFSTVDGFEISGLGTLCRKNKALRSLGLYGCRGITAKEGEGITGKRSCEGNVGKVLVHIERGEVLDDEEWKQNQYGSSSGSGAGSSNEDEDGEGDENEEQDEDEDEDEVMDF